MAKNEKEAKNKAEELAAEEILAAEQSAEKESDAAESISANAEAETLMEISVTEFNTLQEEKAVLEEKYTEMFDGWQRERADFSNYKKRVDRENQQLKQTITGQVIKKYLEILDDMERALKNRPENGDGATWAEGIELISRKVKTYLDAEGITKVAEANEEFDPTRHEAISNEDNPDFESGYIIEVVQQGYMLGDRVIRPALVRVAR
jgi:molecular chaperone GrpE